MILYITSIFNQESFFDWFWLYIQISILLYLIITEFMKTKYRNLYLILISLTFLILVQGQAYWVLNQFNEESSFIQHLNQTISRDGAKLANFYVGLSIICFFFTYQFLYRLNKSKKYDLKTKNKREFVPRLLSYYILVLWILGFGIVLIQLLGGLVETLTNPGRAIAGQTLLLVLMGVGKLPLFHKIEKKQKVLWLDILIFFASLIITLFNSRFLASFFILQLMLIVNYCHKEVGRKWILSYLFILFFIFIVYGIYRDYGNFISSGILLEEGQNFLDQRLGDGGLIDWFYRLNVEGFTGIAGILTYELSQGYIKHDFGLSNLRVFTQLLPNSLRNDVNLPFFKIHEFFSNIYPYSQASVVPSGFENAYAHFGILGILFFGCLLGFFAYTLYALMLDNNANRLRICILSTASLQLIRGTIATTIFFALADLVIYWIYKILILLTGRKLKVGKG